MNEIDLKHTKLFLRDGYTGAAAVNNASGYTLGATTMAIDSHSGIIPTGTTFSVVGSTDGIHEVISHTETSTNTTSITFTPGLAGAVVDNAVITLLPNQIEVRIGEGNLTYEVKKARVYRKNAGRIDAVRDGDEDPVEVNFDFVWEDISASSGDPPTIEEALYNIGAAAGWVSSDPDTCQPFSVDLVLLKTPQCDEIELEKIELKKFRYESVNHNLKESSIACKGNCNITRPTTTRIAS